MHSFLRQISNKANVFRGACMGEALFQRVLSSSLMLAVLVFGIQVGTRLGCTFLKRFVAQIVFTLCIR
jgi:hypothetical protein